MKCIVMCMLLAATLADDAELKLTTKTPILTTREGTTSEQWLVDVVAHPEEVTLTWLSPHNTTLSTSPKYTLTWNETRAVLQIRNIKVSDMGTYRLLARSSAKEETLELILIVKVKPTASFTTVPELFYFPGQFYDITCRIDGVSTPKIKWLFQICDESILCTERLPVQGPHNITEYKVNETYISTLEWTPEQSGYMICEANGSEGRVETSQHIWVVDLGFLNRSSIDGRAQATAAIEGDNITLTCTVAKLNIDGALWYLDSVDQRISDLDLPNVVLKNETTLFGYKSILTITNITQGNNGVYYCKPASFSDDQADNVTINVKAMETPRINSPALERSMLLVGPRDQVEWPCHATGVPTPTIRWFKDDVAFTTSITDNHTLSIKHPTWEAEGTYTCEAWSRAGFDRRSLTVTFNDKIETSVPTTVTITLVVLIIVVSILIAVVVVNQRNAKIRRNELKVAGLTNFEEGALESLNPLLPIASQADLLPYNKKWEFPREQLKLGKQLGAGAFGVVVKAEALGIIKGESVTTVAVKMVKRNADITHVKNLAAELKIMAHLGKHLNVVNLLGACTKNLTTRELLVIVEYCRHGNLQNYLLRHRGTFIDELNPKTRELDPIPQPSATKKRLQFEDNSEKMAVISMGPDSASGVGVEIDPKKHDEDCTTSNNPRYTNMGSTNSPSNSWRCNHRWYDKEDVRPICTRDLTCWAFQIARGMEYLAGRKVLHGDLAARNILLADDSIVKICDFGLSKHINKTDNYRKKGEGLLPVKWMAIESLRDRVFSTQSDVWSFGIVLWEIFSLAKTPYPEMDVDKNMLKKLVAGYRMEEPEYAPKQVNEIMQRCWLTKPNDRPTFSEVVDQLCNIIEKNVRTHYIDLNDSYTEWNRKSVMDGHDDYLMMMNAPTYDNLLSPISEESGHNQYVNRCVFTALGCLLELVTGEKDFPINVFTPNQSAVTSDMENPPYVVMKSLETHL